MEGELKKFIKVWITAFLCLSYCHLIVSRFIPKGILRLISLLPVIFIFIALPLNLHYFHLCGPTTFFLVWLGNFKLLLFSFDLGPLSPPPPSLFHFISIACLPIKIKQNPTPKSGLDPKSRHPIAQNETPNSPILLALKALTLAAIIRVYDYRQHFHPYVILVLYCCHVYLALELVLALTAAPARAVFGFEIDPQFNEPYRATSLQDFWGRRWNLMVTSILRPTVYDPIRRVALGLLGPRGARLTAVMSTFAVSGLMHEVVYYYLTRVGPTWEVMCFFVLQGACLVVEMEVKKAVGGAWKLHSVVSGTLTLVFLAVTGNLLFFPQLVRNEVDLNVIGEYAILVDFLKKKILR